MTDLDPRVAEWDARLRDAFDIEAETDLAGVLGVAGVAAHSVVRPAAPVTTYLLGVAVGRALAEGADPAAVFAAASRRARELAQHPDD